jgi:glycosyltransferase involved in cell wall biosynthesis
MDDVCLVLEGTYPYVAGGVSSWVYDLIRRLKDTTFSIVFLGANRGATRKMHYPIPDNVREFREYYLFDYRIDRQKKRKTHPERLKDIERLIRELRVGKADGFEAAVRHLTTGEAAGSLDLYQLAYEPEGWRILQNLYRAEEHEVSFIDYFWTWRYLYLPFLSLLKIDLPAARLYHSPSTGYAGLLASIAKIRTRRPFLLTEHGIYTRERKIDISTSDWIYNENSQEVKVIDQKDIFREWWMSLFTTMSRLAYQQADQILTLHQGNRAAQIAEGADPAKVRIIPNGIDIPAHLPAPPPDHPPTIALIGRVVPIKDIKTFLRACQMIRNRVPDLRAWVLGPTDEDPKYFEECRLLVKMNKLESNVEFKGKVKLSEYFSQIDVNVLTSISEGQPLVTLEGYAYQVPAVMTDVGSCAELANGADADDRLIGPSGLITAVCDPEATARAVEKLLLDPELRLRMGRNGRRRALAYYRVEDMVSRYQKLYSHYSEEVRW